jgi:hypothetical protein
VPTGARGIFLLYEPTRRFDEDRAAYLDRFVRTNKPLWRVLTPAEWDQVWYHVTTCDFPETAAEWCDCRLQKAGLLEHGGMVPINSFATNLVAPE